MNRRKSIALLLSGLMVATCMLSGCNSSSGTIEETSKETIPVLEITERQSEESSEALVETTIESSIEETTPEDEDVTLSMEEFDGAMRDLIASFEDDALFGLIDQRLFVNNNGEISCYEMALDGGVTNIEIDPSEYDYYSNFCRFTKATILRCPILPYLGSGEIIGFDDSISNGEYYGSILGISSDGTMAFMLIGEPVRITDELLNNQDPNSQMLDYNGTLIDISGDYSNVAEISHPVNIYYDLLGASDVHYTVNNRFVIIPIADDAVIGESNIGGMTGFEMNPEDYGQTTFTQSICWGYLMSRASENYGTINGWYSSIGVIEPVIITDGYISEITINLR